MNGVVVDASVTLAWGFPDEKNAYADSVLEKLEGQTIVVPTIWAMEIANALLVGERRNRLRPAHIHRFLALLGGLPVLQSTHDPTTTITSLLPLARDHHLSAYDAAYLELAMRNVLPLATLDNNLQQAAMKTGVMLYELDSA